QIGAGNTCRARGFGAAAVKHGIISIEKAAQWLVDADIHAAQEADALTFHLRHAAVDMVLFHLEVWNAVTQQTTGAAFALIDIDHVTGARQLLCSSKASRAGADDRDRLAG